MVAVFVDDIIIGYDKSARNAYLYVKQENAKLIKIGEIDITEGHELTLAGVEYLTLCVVCYLLKTKGHNVWMGAHFVCHLACTAIQITWTAPLSR